MPFSFGIGLRYLCLVAALAIGQPASAQWVAVASGTMTDLHSVSFSNQAVGYAGGMNGTLIKSLDGGTTWQPVASPTTEEIIFVHSTAPNHVALVTSNGIYRSMNGGNTFAEDFHNDAVYMRSATASGQNLHLIIASEPHVLLYSEMDGVVDTLLTEFSLQLANLFFLNQQVGFASDHSSTAFNKIYQTMDGGQSWTAIASAPPHNLTVVDGLFFVSESVGWSVGWFQPHCAQTGNGGDSWTFLPIQEPEQMPALKFIASSGTHLYAAGFYGKIFRTETATDDWQEQPTPTTETINDIAFLNDSLAVAVGTTGLVLRTNSGGTTEVTAHQSSTSPALYPNPCSDQLMVRSAMHIPIESCKVYDMHGRLCLLSEARGLQVVLDTGALPTGFYQVLMTDVNGTTAALLVAKVE